LQFFCEESLKLLTQTIGPLFAAMALCQV
jgi:hypothetical protein